ncbi:YgaP family membrane protein [Reichenbachiella ulvae]|uniref:DUF2892 domain-containing protein n=1 Tax=Reichenbachiella ulvae TaxID=2980104 RepID=A0ABT3CVA6_9BACT|nr:DUF2892 domain-containing protein [Reichenbachiella ulvae]MCV9387511.1 DUF2892 domain-containing protein [Reichenbachiella ulvae]
MRNRVIRFIAGALVLTGLILGMMVSTYWFILVGFVAVNLMQSSLTKWCLMEDILKKAGVKD